MQNKSAQHNDTNNKSIDCQEPVILEPKVMDLKLNIGRMLCQEKEQNHDEPEIKTEDTYDRNIAFFDDNKNVLISNNDFQNTNNVSGDMFKDRIIADMFFMWNEIYRTFENHVDRTMCQFKDWKLINYCHHGLLTQLFFKCEICNYKISIWSEPTISERRDVNTAAVSGSRSVGIDYSQLKEFCTVMNIPCMSEKTCMKYKKRVKQRL